MTRSRLRRLLVLLVSIPAALLAMNAPAFAVWTTLSGGDPVQFDHVCHDGTEWDWARAQVFLMSYHLLGNAYWKPRALAGQSASPNTVDIYVNSATPANLIMTADTSVPYHPYIVPNGGPPNEDDGNTIHLLEGKLHVFWPQGRWMASGTQVFFSPEWQESVDDCYLYAGVRPMTSAPGKQSLALLGTQHLNVATLHPGTFRLAAGGLISITKPAGPLSWYRKDVNGDGYPDLVFTFAAAGTGITSTSLTEVLTGQTPVAPGEPTNADHLLRGTALLHPITFTPLAAR